MNEIVEIFLKYIVTSLAVSGGLFAGIWKGADVVINAMSKRAEAVAAQRKLDIDLMEINYTTAMAILRQQSISIKELEDKNEKLNNKVDTQKQAQEDAELLYITEINALRDEIRELKEENKQLRTKLEASENNYSAAIDRIAVLEDAAKGKE